MEDTYLLMNEQELLHQDVNVLFWELWLVESVLMELSVS